jgi:hypothetical protein
MALSVGQELQGRYRIDALLGQGGMGAVYRATDLRFGTPVAVKENRIASPESQRQFSREAELLHRLRHPNLPRVSDYFFLPGQGQYLVMDYVEGEDLGRVLSRHGAIPEAQALRWIGAVLDALVFMHSQGILHRDVKPANVRLTPQGQVFLVDFGLAKAAYLAQETTTGARAVTPGYAPPEQYGMGRTDARTDIYSVGATLYAILTGTAPPDAWQLVTKQAQLIAPRQLQAGVSPETEAAVLQAMRIAPDERFQTAAEMRTALIQRPAASDTQARRPARPTWFWLALAGVGILVLALTIGITVLLGGGDQKTPGAVTVGTMPPPSPTISPTIAPLTATPSPYLYTDDFGDPESGWDIDQGSGGASGYVAGEYHLSQYEVDTVRWANPQPALDLADTRVEVDARLIEGNLDNGMGVLVRSQANDKDFYEFEISSDGYYKVNKRGADGWTSLLDWTASPAIKQGLGVTNHLEVVCDGDQFTFFVNGTRLADLTDSSYSSGNIGLSATCLGEGGVLVAFDNLTVRSLR